MALDILGFDWDAGNWPKCSEHGVSKEEIEALLLTDPRILPDRTGAVAVVTWFILFAASLTAGWFTYSWAFRILRERVPLEKYLDHNLFKGLF